LLKCFFFWGCFTSYKAVIDYTRGIKPKTYVDASYKKAEGKFCDLSNMSGRKFFDLLNRLDRGIEIGYFRVTIICELGDGKKRYAYAYIPCHTSDPDNFFNSRFFITRRARDW